MNNQTLMQQQNQKIALVTGSKVRNLTLESQARKLSQSDPSFAVLFEKSIDYIKLLNRQIKEINIQGNISVAEIRAQITVLKVRFAGLIPVSSEIKHNIMLGQFKELILKG